MDVKVVENADNCVHITMPAPPSGSMELSDEELSNAAGGVDHCSCNFIEYASR
jgi:mersacidin/lichenicidin family type 2 lantibiotic